MTNNLLAFDFPINIRAWKCLAAAKIAGVPMNFVALEMGKDNETKEFFDNCHPLGRTPVLQTEEGYLFESNAILRQIARMDKINSFLYGRTAFEAGQVDQWLDYSNTEMNRSSYFFVSKSFGMPTTQEEDKKMMAEAHTAIAGVDKWLEVRTYLAGERLTIADIAVASAYDWVLRFSGVAQEFTSKYKHATRHYNTVMSNPKFVEVLTARKAPMGIPKAEGKKADAAAPAPAAKKQEIPDGPVTAGPLIVNFKKFAADKSAYFMNINLEYTNDTMAYIAGPEGFEPREILTMLTDKDNCEKYVATYIKVAKTKESKQDKVKEEISKLVEDFMSPKVGGCKNLQAVAEKKAVEIDPETAELIAEFSKFIEGKGNHTKPAMWKAVLEYLPEGFHKADIKSMLTVGDDCDELLETYIRLAVVPGNDKLRVRTEIVNFVEGFAESKGIVQEDCFSF